MMHDDPDPLVVQRLLEGWLPLAQEANRQYGWGLDGAGIETLILQAAPALHHARSALEARALLWRTFRALDREQDV